MRRPQLTALNRQQHPNGIPLISTSATCELGGFAPKFRTAAGKYAVKNCGQRAIIEIAGVPICRHCYGLLEAIARDSEALQEGHGGKRCPITYAFSLKVAVS